MIGLLQRVTEAAVDVAGERVAENVMWSYEEPVTEAEAIAGYVAFYADLVDEWFEDEVPVDNRASTDAHYVNPLLAWLINTAPAIDDPSALTLSLAERLLEAGIPVWRLNIVIRTFVVKEGRCYYNVGGAVVADSDPRGEYCETLDKARALTTALRNLKAGRRR